MDDDELGDWRGDGVGFGCGFAWSLVVAWTTESLKRRGLETVPPRDLRDLLNSEILSSVHYLGRVFEIAS